MVSAQEKQLRIQNAEAEGYVAEAIGDVLNQQPEWSAIGLDIGEIHFTDEYGDKFILTVAKTEIFPGEEDE